MIHGLLPGFLVPSLLLLIHVNVVPRAKPDYSTTDRPTGLASMEWEPIRKRAEDCAAANLRDYDGFTRQFEWSQARALLDGLPGGGLNIAYEAVDRHVLAGRGQKLALRWLGRDQVRDYSYAALAAAENRFRNVLAQHGVT
jgi:acetyl-CoA synthetase